MKTSAHSRLTTRPDPLPLSQLLVLLAMLFALFSEQNALAQKHALTNTWSMAPTTGTVSFMNITNNLTRGLAYNPATGHVLAVSRTPTLTETNAIYILDKATGSILGTLPFDPVVITNGTFVINMAGVTADGVIYVCNLTTDAAGATTPFKLYRWASETAQPQLVYSGDPSANTTVGTSPRRYGDSLAIRGTGSGTQILLGTLNQTVALLTTTDGINFTATKITTDGEVADTRWGLAWGTGDTFWAKQSGKNLKKFTLNIPAATAAVTTTVPLSAVTGGPLDVDLDRNLVAIVDAANHKLRVYDISNPAAPIQTDLTKDMPAANANGNFVGAVYLKNGLLFALETNNGIQAYTVHDAVFPPGISTQPASLTLWEHAKYILSVGITGTAPFTYHWQYQGADLPGATAATYTIPEMSFAQEGSYRVIVANASGSVTSSPALLTVTPGNPSAQAENIWSIEPNIRPYLTSGYKEYGVAINPLTTNVIVLTRPNPTNMLVVLDPFTGAEKHYIDYSGLLPTPGYNKVAVADDGVIYMCNLTTSTTTSPLRIDGLSDDGSVPALAGRQLFEGDPGFGATAPDVVWGGTLAVRGGGEGTQILLGSGSWNKSSTTVSILRTLPGGTFYATPITVTGAPDKFARLGLDWGPGTNTFWAKSVGSLVLVEFDIDTATAFAKKIYPTSGSRSVASSITGISYDPPTGLLAGLQNGAPPSPVSVPIYNVNDIEAGPLWVDQELFTTHNPDVEYQGNVDFGAGYLVALGVNNGLKAFKINSGFVSSLPVIVTHPVDAEWYMGSNPTLTVAADSATPLTYQWYYYGTQAIAGATSASLTLTNVQLSQAGDYLARVSNANGSRDSLSATLTVLPLNNTAQMTNIWSVLPGTRPYLNTAYFDYGLSFNPMNSNLLVASFIGTNATPVVIGVMDALTGTHKHDLDTTGVSGGNRFVHKIGVADDGTVFAANRTTSPGTVPFTLYRWANDNAATIPTIAFSGDPMPLNTNASKNIGWTLEVRGAGVNTEVLLSTANTNVLAILNTTDGLNFTPNNIIVTGAPPAFARLGIAFGAGNTFWAKAWQGDGGRLYLVEYNLATGTGKILKTYETTQVSSTMTALAYNDTLKFLAGTARDNQKNVQVYSVADLDFGPKLLDQELFPTYNASIEANGALDFGGNTYLFALNENNGVMAFVIDSSYHPPVNSFKILSATKDGGNVTIAWEAQSGVSYQVQSVDALGGTWQNLGNPVTTNGATAIYIDTATPGNRFYRVRAN